MCGIFGQFSKNGAKSELVHEMGQLLVHRGPDGYDVYSNADIAFGAGRLAIIDLSAPVGPLFNEDGAIGVAFNGEIYNYRALRQQLEQLGHQFRTDTDTEVLVHGYEEWGKALPLKLRGMFAFCIYDRNENYLFLARDRAGEKPLYHTRTNTGEFVFASEIKAILRHPDIKALVNHHALPSYLALGYVPAPMTMFEGIFKLAPASTLTIHFDATQEDRYWQADTTILSENDLSYEQATKDLRAHLIDAVESRMVSDVPVGALLSGGVDSTSVVALMQAINSSKVDTFTVGFDFAQDSYGDDKFNVDLHYSKIAAEHIGTRHHAITIKDDFVPELLPHLVYQMDEPIAQHSIIQSTYVSALARHMDIPVLLSGDAGDELFMGYTHYGHDQKISRINKIPKLIRHKIIKPVIEQFLPRYAHFIPKITADDPILRYLEWMRFLRLDDIEQILLDGSDTYQQLHNTLMPWLSAHSRADFAERIAYTSFNLWVAEDSNMRVDKTSMLMSIETRAPLEDHSLVDFAFQLPMAYKLRDGDTKRIFKDAISDLVPQSILKRKKWGFIPPTSDWLRTNLRPLVDRYLSHEYVESAGLCQPDIVTRIVAAHMTKEGYHLKEIWALLVLHIWHALYIDQSLILTKKIMPLDIVDASQIEMY